MHTDTRVDGAPARSEVGRTMCTIAGIGYHLPAERLGNQWFEGFLDTNDAWITQRTGIEARHRLADDEATSDLGIAAARRALDDAGRSTDDIDCIICATCTPDMILPSTACVMQRKLGLSGCTAMDVSAACSGFTYATSVAAGLIASQQHRCVLVVGAEAMTRFLDFTDRGSCILFGDAGAAAILEGAGSGAGKFDLVYTTTGADGNDGELITIEGGGSVHHATEASIRDGRHYVRLDGREVFRRAVRQMTNSARAALDTLGLQASDIDWVVPHQANRRIIEAVAQQLDYPQDRVVIDITDVGNTTAASIPMAFARARDAGKFQRGQRVMTLAYGAGATWGCQLYIVR